jgi:Transglutaminase-like superfamily
VRTVADLHRMALASGCTLVTTQQIGGELVGVFDCPDIDDGRPLATAVLLSGLQDDDGLDPFDPAVILSIESAGELAPMAALAYVQQHVRFVDEPVETFQTPTVTLAKGEGDCDDSARLLVSLAEACGIAGRLVFFFVVPGGQPNHVCAQLWSGGAWQWAETTIPARLGEHPFAALARLGLRRPDLDGTAYILVDGQAVPLDAAGSMGAMDNLVQRVATPVTAQDLANALAAAWPTSVGGSPGSAIQVLVAQSAFETGAWGAVWNNNLGNVKYSGGTDYFQMTASEGSGASTTMVPSKWRSYDSLAAGAAAWLSFMAHNYSSAMASAMQGDVPGFVAALKSSGYFTGDATAYTNGVQQYYSQYSSLAPSAAAGVASGAIATVTQGQVSEVDAIATVAGGLLLGALLGFFL